MVDITNKLNASREEVNNSVNDSENLLSSGVVFDQVLQLGAQSTVVDVDATRFKVNTGSEVELLYLWEPSGALPSPPFTIEDIQSNAFSGYTLTINGSDYEVISYKTEGLRLDGKLSGFGVAYDGTDEGVKLQYAATNLEFLGRMWFEDNFSVGTATTITYDVEITCPEKVTITAINPIDWIIEFQGDAKFSNLTMDFNGLNSTADSIVVFRAGVEVKSSEFRNILGINSSFNQYCCYIEPSDNDVIFDDCYFHNAKNFVQTPGNNGVWAGFIFCKGEASNVTDQFHLKLFRNRFDGCETLFSNEFSETQKAESMDADAVRIFYDNETPEIKDRSRLTSLNNVFANCQKRFYKPNSTRCYIDGDICEEGSRQVGEPGMSHIIQLRNGASATLVNLDITTDIRFYPVVQYESYRDLVIKNCKFKNVTLSTEISRLFAIINDATINQDAKVIVRNVNMIDFFMLYNQPSENNLFIDIKNTSLTGATRYTNYEHEGSRGHRLIGSRVEMTLIDGGSDDQGMKDRQSGATSGSGAFYKDIDIIDINRTRLGATFPNAVDVRCDTLILDNVKIYQEYDDPVAPFLSGIDARLANDLKMLGCSAKFIQASSNNKVYLANNIGQVSLSGNTTEEEYNTNPWYGIYG